MGNNCFLWFLILIILDLHKGRGRIQDTIL